MGHSAHDPVTKGRRAWNAGRKLGAKRALKPQQVWAIRFWLDHELRTRDRAMFDLAIDSKLRGCDIVKLKLATSSAVVASAVGPSSSSARPVDQCSSSCSNLPVPASSHGSKPGVERSTTMPFRAGWTASCTSAPGSMRALSMSGHGIGLRSEDYGTHSLRRTKASLIYKRTGNLRAVQILLGHTKIESTVRYLGVASRMP